MRYRAVCFDRDNTLLRRSPDYAAGTRALIEGWTGRPYVSSYEADMRLFDQAGYPAAGLKSVEEEIAFWKRYYRCMLAQQGLTAGLQERAGILFWRCWCRGLEPFPETEEVLRAVKRAGLKIGVISDTSPSLPLTLEAAGLGGYPDCCICSDLVGVMKPDPRIYQAALDALGLRAEECIYIDDYDVEADGARALGFTAFHLVREGPLTGPWDIASLRELLPWLDG